MAAKGQGASNQIDFPRRVRLCEMRMVCRVRDPLCDWERILARLGAGTTSLCRYRASVCMREALLAESAPHIQMAQSSRAHTACICRDGGLHVSCSPAREESEQRERSRCCKAEQACSTPPRLTRRLSLQSDSDRASDAGVEPSCRSTICLASASDICALTQTTACATR